MNERAFQNADLVVSLGISMAEKVRRKGIRNSKIKIISDWADTKLIRPVEKKNNPLIERYDLKGKFVIMYSGNIGLSQDFSTILLAVKGLLDDPSLVLLFVGEGSAKGKLVSEVRTLGLNNVIFLPYQPKEMLSYSLSMGDLHLVPMKKDVTGSVVPSKVYGIMGVGRPYLAIAEPENEPVVLAKKYDIGLYANPGDVKEIESILRWAIDHKDRLEDMGKKAREIVEAEFDKSVVVEKWRTLLREVLLKGQEVNSPKS
jgi:glycosyltransferase involved in cell wall biosynthesis